MASPGRSRTLITLAIIVALGALLRLYKAGHGLALDELATAWVIGGGKSEILSRSQVNVLNPFYFFIASTGTDLFGMTEIGLRFWSLVAGIALIPLGCLTAVRITGSMQAGLVAALLFAVDPTSLYYAQDARPYALVELFSLVAVLAFLGVLRRPTLKRRAALIATSLVLFYLHYTAALLLVALACFYLLLLLKRRPIVYRPWQAVVDGLILAAACLPALTRVRVLVTHRAVLGQSAASDPPKIEELMTLLPVVTILIMPVLAAAAVGYLSRLPPRSRATAPADPESVLALLGCWLMIPVTLAWALARADFARLTIQRYVLCAWPAAPILVALVFVRLRSPLSRIALLAACLGLGSATEGPVRRLITEGDFTGHDFDGWRETLADLNAQAAADDLPLLVHSGLVEADLVTPDGDARMRDYCLAPVSTLYPVRGARHVHLLPYSMFDTISADILQDVFAHGGAWVVWRGSKQDDFINAMERECRVTGREVTFTEVNNCKLLHLLRLRVVDPK